MTSRFIRAAATAIAVFAVTACSDNAVAPVPSEGSSLTITPPTATVYEADAVVLSAVFRNASGEVVPNAPITWSVNDTLRAQLGGNGYVLALKNGTVKVAASSNGINAAYDLTIVRPAVENVAVLLPTTVITRGDVMVVGVRVNGPGSRVIFGRTTTITSTDPNVALIDASGRVRAVAAGTATIRANVDGVIGLAQIQVTPAATELELSKLDGASIPILISTDTLITNGAPDVREVYLESGTFIVSGTTQLRYTVSLRLFEYKARMVNGQKQLIPFGPQSESDRGLVAYDARGDLQLASEVFFPLTHIGTPLSGGIQVRYRIPGTDEYLTLFFRRPVL